MCCISFRDSLYIQMNFVQPKRFAPSLCYIHLFQFWINEQDKQQLQQNTHQLKCVTLRKYMLQYQFVYLGYLNDKCSNH